MRRVHTLVVLILLLALSPASLVSARADQAEGVERSQRVRISITASPEWVRKGGIVTLTGTVKGVRGRTSVTILQKNKGARKWVVEAVKRTSRKGRFTHREDIRTGDRTYKACVKRACDSVLVHMGTAPSQDTAVGISGVSASTVEAGQAFTTAGVATANLNGRQVQVQAYDAGSGSWGVVALTTVQNGQWSVATAVTTAGRAVPIRAVFAGAVGLKSSTSAALSIAVYGWYYLQDMSTVEGEWDSTGAYRISGVTYPYSVAEDTEYIQVDLQRSCIRFSAVIGLSDSSVSGSRASVRMLADSVERYSNTNLTLGTAYPVSFDVNGALRLVVQPAEVSGAPDIVFGDARVLCAY